MPGTILSSPSNHCVILRSLPILMCCYWTRNEAGTSLLYPSTQAKNVSGLRVVWWNSLSWLPGNLNDSLRSRRQRKAWGVSDKCHDIEYTAKCHDIGYSSLKN